MTLIAIWSDDAAKSLYIATDSRLSSAFRGKRYVWDRATKIFQIAALPEVVAYCGMSQPLLTTIGQTATCLRYTKHLAKGGNKNTPQLQARVPALGSHLSSAFKNYPASWLSNGGQCIFAGYDFRKMRARAYRVKIAKAGLTWHKKGSKDQFDELNLVTGATFIGSGAPAAREYEKKGKHPFVCLKSVILAKKEETVGGVPQVFRIDSSGVTPIGIVWDRKPYLGGMEMFFRSDMSDVDWRNKSFKSVDYPRSARISRVKKKSRR